MSLPFEVLLSTPPSTHCASSEGASSSLASKDLTVAKNI